jgi:hypothetical protein
MFEKGRAIFIERCDQLRRAAHRDDRDRTGSEALDKAHGCRADGGQVGGSSPAVVKDQHDGIVGDANVEHVALGASFLDHEIIDPDIYDSSSSWICDLRESESALACLRTLERHRGGQNRDRDRKRLNCPR